MGRTNSSTSVTSPGGKKMDPFLDPKYERERNILKRSADFAKQYGTTSVSPQLRPSMNKSKNWHPMMQGNQFEKTLSQTKSLTKTLNAMPDKDFQHHFKSLGIISKADLSNPQKVQAIKQFVGQHVPFVKNLKDSKNINEVSAEMGDISRDFVGAMSPPFNHAKISTALKKANTLIGRVKDPNERSQIGAMIGALTQIADSTTAQAGGTGKITIASKCNKGKKLSEAEKEEEVPVVKAPLKKKPKPKEEPKDPSGLETDKEEEPKDSQEDPQPKDGKQDVSTTEEQKAFSDALNGQVVKFAKIEPTNTGGELTLEMVGTEGMPIRLVWEGKRIIVYIRNRPYFIRRA